MLSFKKNSTPLYFYSLSLLLLFLLPVITRYFGDGNLPPLDPVGRAGMNVILGIIWAGYALIISRHPASTKISMNAWMFFSFIGFSLCLIRPVFSGDLYEYMLSGRILGVYHRNPYLTAGIEFPGDLFRPYAIWVRIPYNYGPAWVWVQWVAPTLLSFSVASGIFFQKCFLYLIFIGSSLVFYGIARRVSPEKAHWLLAAYAFNPNMIVHGQVDGHNDIYMIFWMLLAVYLFLEGRTCLGLAAATVGFLTKYASFFMVSLLFLWKMRQLSGATLKTKIKVLAQATISVALTAVLLICPFGEGWRGMASDLVLARDWFYSNTVPYAIWAGFERIHVSLTQTGVQSFFRLFFMLNVAASHAWILFKPKLEAKNIFQAISWIMISFYLSQGYPFYGGHLNIALPFLILAQLPKPTLWLSLYSAAGLFAYFKRLSFLFLGSLFVYVIAIIPALRSQIRGKVLS